MTLRMLTPAARFVPSPVTTPWADLSTRLAWARAFRRELATRHAEITSLISDELGKPPFECFVSELLPLLRALRHAQRHAPRLLRTRRVASYSPLSPGLTIRTARAPLGRVGIIATWNYPVGLLGIQLAHALLAGNRVTVKPSERSPRSQALLLDFARSTHAGIAAHAIELLPPTRDAGAALVHRASLPPTDPSHIDHILFTGSTDVGRNIAAALATTLTPSTLELSGHDSAIVFADANADLAARSIWAALTLNAGQTCMGPRRAIISAPAYDAFLAALTPLIAATPALTLVHESEADRTWSCIRTALDAGARPLARDPAPPHSRSLLPAALTDCHVESPLALGSHFGPALAILRADSDDHALALHSTYTQRLATSLFTRDARRARALAPTLASGTVTINDCVVPTGHPAVPITGVGPSGWGISRGPEGLLAMTRPVTITTTGRVRTPTTMLTGKSADRFMRTAARLLR